MNDPGLPPLDPDLDALLDVERRAVAPASALERVWSRIESPSPGGGEPHPPRPLRPGMHFGLPALGAAFLAGGVAGFAAHSALGPPAASHVVYVDRTPPPSPQQPEVAGEIASSQAAATTQASVEPAPRVTPRGAASTTSSLSAERVLLDEARSALATGDAARALGLVDAHARRFSRPQLSEEREALAVQALVALGRYDEARARAARFRAAAPNSLFLPAIEASLASIP
jgi:hypothetical protein